MDPPGRLDHIGVAVPSIAGAAAIYRTLLDLEPERFEEVPTEGVRVAFLPLAGGGAVELLEPTRADSPIARFLNNYGPGLHHISFRVADCRAAIRAAEAANIRVLQPAPRAGADGSLAAFFHPKDTGGVLIEVVQKGEASSPSRS